MELKSPAALGSRKHSDGTQPLSPQFPLAHFLFFASASLAGRSFSRLLREERQEEGDAKARSDGSGGKFFSRYKRIFCFSL